MADPSTVDDGVSNAKQVFGDAVDVFVVPPALTAAPPQLVLMDVDSTFINEEVIELIAEHAGVREQVAEVTERAMRGELDFEQSLRARVETLAGLPVSVLDEVARSVTYSPGIPEFVAAAQAAGTHVALVSGGFDVIVESLAGRLGVTDTEANTLEIVDGKLTGRVTGRVVDRARKAERLAEICSERGFDVARTVAIGDGANDLDMVDAAGYGIAFCAKPTLVEGADASLTIRRMDAVWAALTGKAPGGPQG